MNEIKKISIPVILIALSGLFLFASLVVYLHKGKSVKWVARKMKLGATILTVAGITTGCPPVITCYDPVPVNQFSFDQLDSEDYSIVSNLPDDSILTGKIFERNWDSFIFEIITTDSQLVQKGDVLAADGLFDARNEDFMIILDSKIDTGKYHLNILYTNPENDNNSYLIQQNWLKIK
jgi:hypothetical protein